jgi:hypothetical protein
MTSFTTMCACKNSERNEKSPDGASMAASIFRPAA